MIDPTLADPLVIAVALIALIAFGGLWAAIHMADVHSRIQTFERMQRSEKERKE